MTGRDIEVAPVPRLALTREEAAAACGLSLDSFERHVQPSLRLIRRGRLVLVSVDGLRRWLEENAEPTLPSGVRSEHTTKSGPAAHERPGPWLKEKS